MKKKTGEKEQFYLNIVKEYLTYDNSYGVSEVEFESVKDVIFGATPNEHLSDFPDFIVENGFIEHFQITSSRETGKGAKAARDEAEFIRSYEDELNKKLTEDKNEHFVFEKSRSIAGHTHDFLLESLKNNVEKHLNSLDDYIGQKE